MKKRKLKRKNQTEHHCDEGRGFGDELELSGDGGGGYLSLLKPTDYTFNDFSPLTVDEHFS